MLQGDLASTPLRAVLRMLADGAATGCLHVADPAGAAAQVFLRAGSVYAVVAPGARPALGDRLVSVGALAPQALDEALQAQRTQPQGRPLSVLLVHLGLVDQAVVEESQHEQLRAALSELLDWQYATWKFRVNQRTREDVVPLVTVAQLLHDLSLRRADVAAVQPVLHSPKAVPRLSAADTASRQTEIDPDAWSLLCKVDGTRTMADLARECGSTMYEAGLVVVALVQAGLLEVDEAEHRPATVEPERDTRQIASSLLAAFGGAVPDQRTSARWEDVALPTLPARPGPVTASDDVFAAPVLRPGLAELHRQAEERRRAEREQLAAGRRAADAPELVRAQEELEAGKAAAQAQFEALHGEDHMAQVVDIAEVRAASEAEAARLDEQAQLAEQARQARLAEEAEQTRLAEEAERARLAEEAQQARMADEARLAEEAQVAEQVRLTEEAQLAHEAEQARLAEEAQLAHEAEQARHTAETEAPDPAVEDQWPSELPDGDLADLLPDTGQPSDAHPYDDGFDPALHAAAFAELRASAAEQVLEVPAPRPTAVEPPVEDRSRDEEPSQHFAAPGTDTAALLRELSSLGLDDVPPLPTPPVRPAPARPVSTLPAAKRRKGLFGR